MGLRGPTMPRVTVVPDALPLVPAMFGVASAVAPTHRPALGLLATATLNQMDRVASRFCAPAAGWSPVAKPAPWSYVSVPSDRGAGAAVLQFSLPVSGTPVQAQGGGCRSLEKVVPRSKLALAVCPRAPVQTDRGAIPGLRVLPREPRNPGCEGCTAYLLVRHPPRNGRDITEVPRPNPWADRP